MSSHNRKRKHRSSQPHGHTGASSSSPQQFQFLGHHEGYTRADRAEDTADKHDPLEALYIQAHEADLIRGPSAKVAAQSLEVVEYQTTEGPEGSRCIAVPKIGSALIKLGGDTFTAHPPPFANDDDALPATKQDINATTVWVDRYDARLLLDPLPTFGPASVPVAPDSPTGFSDLSSDAEDTFFFTPDEAEDFRREKRRRLLEQAREERLKARQEEDDVEDENPAEEDIWGGSDEEPDESSKPLMQRTALHLLSSPNPAQLEMRILANHGGDRRFAFLRGRWGRAWNLAKAKARIEKDKKEKKTEKSAGLGVLAGYGSDDSDSASEVEDVKEDETVKKDTIMVADEKGISDLPSAEIDEEAAKEARRKRLKEWTEKRRTRNG